MRSFIKGKKCRPPSRVDPASAPRFSKAREVGLHELSAALGMQGQMPTLQAISTSRDFPAPLGRRFGLPVWKLADVADYFDRIGWPDDAKALRAWGG